MNLLILFIGTLTLATTAQDNSYIEVGLAAHPMSLDMPEIDLENPIATYEVGIESDGITVYFLHNSSLLVHDEEGAGLNMIGVKKRFNFN